MAPIRVQILEVFPLHELPPHPVPLPRWGRGARRVGEGGSQVRGPNARQILEVFLSMLLPLTPSPPLPSPPLSAGERVAGGRVRGQGHGPKATKNERRLSMSLGSERGQPCPRVFSVYQRLTLTWLSALLTCPSWLRFMVRCASQNDVAERAGGRSNLRTERRQHPLQKFFPQRTVLPLPVGHLVRFLLVLLENARLFRGKAG